MRLVTAPCDCGDAALLGGRRVEEIPDPAQALARFQELFMAGVVATLEYRAGGPLPAMKALYAVVHCQGQHVIGPWPR